jgi:diguanylate cyclase (GGDEF)-like protein
VVGGCLNGIAAVALKRGDPDTALPYFTRAIAHLEAAHNDEKLAGTYNNLSLIYYAKGRYDQALDHMSRALRLYEETGNAPGQGIALNAIGNVYNKLDDRARAREHFERALAIAETTGHKQLVASTLVNLAEVHSALAEWDAALANLNRALAVSHELGSKDYVSVCLNNIGDVLREKGQSGEALRFYLESMRLFETMSARPRLVVSYLNIGKLYRTTGNDALAESYLVKAFDLAREVGEIGLQKDAAEALSGLYEARGDYRRAYTFQASFNQLKEQLFSRENLEKVNTLQARIDAEKQQRSLDLLRKESEIQVLEMKRQRLWIGLIALALVAAAVLALTFLRRYREKSRLNAELATAYARVSELASHDALTGLLNRRSAMQRLEEEAVRTARTGRPFGVVMGDVDDFKRINDRRGHAAGDAVLREVAALLRTALRAQDTVARWGGEEFLLVLPETSREGAAAVAEKVRAGIAALRVPHADEEVACTVTFGVSACASPEALPAALNAADEALYEGKRAGKNTVVLAAA